ncbi:MAG TPA: peptide ABC transporter substrate-binding protein [Verrucomicrobiales bacterium]|jgi:oligopeptide transport system substrate-binding protein|nr:peptide ABC transporter substrate-binding protein [Verrucomicrobiales bacterium]HCI91110.1 peptide ABC transporter substrate-binding protein [Verrucomicrobiales bacterium]HCL96550.1 peptide ABC transporter substrate-binding protein [Verrucomicrobiales bacterium]
MRLAFILSPVLLMPFLSSCDKESPIDKYTEKKILIVGNSNEPAGLDPQIVTGVIESNIITSLFEGLCVQHPSDSGGSMPGAAARWDANEDFTEWTFHLQKNGKWSDGMPVTTADFLFAYERILSPDFAAKYSSMLYYIKNGEKFNKGELKDFSEVGVKAIDDYTLKIFLRAPIPFLPHLTKHYTWYPVPKHTVLAHGTMTERNTYWTAPESMVSNGPFKLETWKFNDRIEVIRNPHYWDADTVKLNAIRYLPIGNKYTEARMFFNDQMHVTERLAPEMIGYCRDRYPREFRQEVYLGCDFIRFNMTLEKFKDVRVRKALSLAIDRQLIIDKVTKGGEEPAQGIVSPMGEYKTAGIAKHNAELASQLIAEAGYSDGNKLKFTLLTTDRDGAKTYAEAFQDMWQKILPVEVSIEQREWKSYQDMMSKLGYEMTTGGWIGDYPDPTTFLDMWKKGDGNNRTGWHSEEYEKLLGKAELATDPAERIRLLRQAETLFLNEHPIVPIYWHTSVYLLHDSVKNWHPLPLRNQPYKFIDLKK